MKFQSTRPIRGATPGDMRRAWHYPISIHAPHTGRDRYDKGDNRTYYISIHAPHTGRDAITCSGPTSSPIFQSTRPIRGATDRHKGIVAQATLFQSTRPIRGATSRSYCRFFHWAISIHAPHTGRDDAALGFGSGNGQFQSTRPIRGATSSWLSTTVMSSISIHAPHTGRD